MESNVRDSSRQQDRLQEDVEESTIFNLRHDVVIFGSCVYSKFLICLCIAYLISEILIIHFHITYFEGFFTYLYIVGIIFILYVFCYLLDTPLCFNFKALQPHNRETDVKEVIKTTLHHRSHGSFIMRLGVTVFGLGTLLYSALELATAVQSQVKATCAGSTLRIVNPGLQIVYTILQIFLICTNPRLNIHRFKTAARFGMMHLMATNFCVWFNIMVKESLHEIREFEVTMAEEKLLQLDEDSHHINKTMVAQIMKSWHPQCSRDHETGEIFDSATPYLLAFVIKYSLISTTVTYLMWKNIGHVSEPDISSNEPVKLKIDFIDSAKGLMAGLVVLFLFTITSVVFFVTLHDEIGTNYDIIIYVMDGIHMLLLIASIVANGYGFIQIQTLQVMPDHKDGITEILLRWSVLGWYLYCMFSIIAACIVLDAIQSSGLVLVVNIINIAEITIQLFFMKELSKRRIRLPKHKDIRPGRQLVTFLIFINLTLWLTYTFEISKMSGNAVQVMAFGAVPWAVLLRLTLPMGIFYRFHSCVVFGESWKDVYRLKSE